MTSRKSRWQGCGNFNQDGFKPRLQYFDNKDRPGS
jgi:hypothetical protein